MQSGLSVSHAHNPHRHGRSFTSIFCFHDARRKQPYSKMATLGSKRNCLCQLPNELQAAIAGFCGQSALLSLALTCHQVRPVALEALYRDVVIKNESAMLQFTRAYGRTKRYKLMGGVRSFKATLPWYPFTRQAKVIHAVDKMTSLRHFDLTYNFDGMYESLDHIMHLPTKLAPMLKS